MMRSPTPSASPSRQSLPLLVFLSLSMLLSALGTSIANVALPTLARAFNAPFQTVQWIVLAYLLAITTLIVSMGRLGDLMGRRRLMLMGIGLFSVASALCGATPWLGGLIAARAMQGMGAAVMMALTMAFASEAASKGKTGSVMGLLGTMSAVGTALGPTLGGLLITGLGWPSVFLINLPLGMVAFGLAWRYLPRDKPQAAGARTRFDTWGSLLLAASIAAYALAMTRAGTRIDGRVALLLVVAVVAAIAFVRAQAAAASPLIRLALFRQSVLSAGVATNALVSTVMMTTLVVGPFYLAGALGLDAARVGLVMSCGPAIAALAGVPAGRGVDRYGAQRMMRAALVVMAAGATILPLVSVEFGAIGYVAPLGVITAGYALFQAANSSAVMTCAGTDQRGAVSGVLNLSRNLGFITGASLMGAVFAATSGGGDLRFSLPAALTAGLRWTYGLAAVLLLVALAIAAAGQKRQRIAA
ncbi:MFS transporter [Achromobacter pestifer]